MSKDELAAMENCSPSLHLTHSVESLSLYSHVPATHSMISAAPVPNVSSVSGPSTTPTLLLTPSAVTKLWLTHLPSKYTLAFVVRLTFSNVAVVIAILLGCGLTLFVRVACCACNVLLWYRTVKKGDIPNITEFLGHSARNQEPQLEYVSWMPT